MHSTNGHQRSSDAIPSGIKDESLLAVKRASLVSVATELFISRGFSEVSVNEIAVASNISIGSLYKYIRTKEDLLWLVMDSIYGTLEDRLMAERSSAHDPAEALDHTFRQLLRAVDAVKRGVLLMYREYRRLPAEAQREFMEREQRVTAIFAEIMRDGNDCGVFHCADPDTAAINILMAAHTWSLKGWQLRDLTLDEYTNRQLRLIFAMAGVVRRDVRLLE